MVYMGTAVVTGRGRAVVTETGMDSELGRIAQRIQELKKELTPLQRKLNRLGRVLAVAALVLVIVIFLAGLML